MKTRILMLTALVSMVMFSCKENPYINAPGDNSKNYDTIPAIAYPMPTPDPEGADVPEGSIDVYEARKICKSLGAGGTTEEKYYIKGWVRKFDDKHESGVTNFGNGTFYIAPTNDGETDDVTFEAYQVMGKNGEKIKSLDEIMIGDFVVIYGLMTNYNNKAYETTGKGAAYIYYSNNPNFGQEPQVDPSKITPDPAGANVPQGCLNVYEARGICAGLSSGAQTNEKYYVKGWIHKVSTTASDVSQYHNATFYIAPTNDGTTNSIDFEAYRIKSINGGNFTSLDQFQVGDFVVIEGPLKNYNGTYETGNGAKLYYSSNPNVK